MFRQEKKWQPSSERLVPVLYIDKNAPDRELVKTRTIIPERFLKVVKRIKDLNAYTDGWQGLEIFEPFTLQTEREGQFLDMFEHTYHVFTEEQIPNNEDFAKCLWAVAKKSKHRKTEYCELLKRMKKPPKSLSEFTDEEYQKILDLDEKYIGHTIWSNIPVLFGP